jgi:hypothetical protein
LVLALASTAIAQSRDRDRKPTPPDNSAIGQYVEDVPGAGGARPSETPGGGGPVGGAPGAGLLSPAASQALAEQGAAGRSAARLAEDTAPEKGDGGPAAAGGGRGSGIKGIVDAVTGSDSDGMGVVLPIILGASVLAALLLLALRRRRGTPQAG